MTVVYRDELKPADLVHVRKIVESTGFFSPEEEAIAVELAEERLSRGVESGYFFVFLEADGEVVAYSCFGPIPATQSSFDLYWIAVRADYRGKGLGKKLLLESERRIQSMGGSRVYIETSSKAQYLPTRAFYLSCRYLQEATLQDFYAPGDSKVIFSKGLT